MVIPKDECEYKDDKPLESAFTIETGTKVHEGVLEKFHMPAMSHGPAEASTLLKRQLLNFLASWSSSFITSFFCASSIATVLFTLARAASVSRSLRLHSKYSS